MDKSLKNVIQKERKELFNEFYNNVTLHGFRFLFNDKNILRRLVWLLLTSSVFAFSTFLFQEIVADFFGYKLVTSLTNEYEKPEQIQFPTVTICPFSTVSKSKLNKSITRLNITYETLREIEKYGFGNLSQSTIEQLQTSNITESDVYQLYQWNYTELTSGEIVDSFGSSPCIFYEKNCLSSDFKVTNSWYGLTNCFQFNYYKEGKSALNPTTFSAIQGLNILMDLKSEDSLESNYGLEGASIIISPFSSPTKTFDRSKLVVVKPGEMAFVKLKVKKSIQVKTNLGKSCGTSDYSLVRKTYPYSKTTCWVDCIIKFAYDKCGCVESDMKDSTKEDIKLCKFKDFECYSAAINLYKESQRHNCSMQCPRACEETSYEIDVSSGALGNQKIFQKLSELKSYFKSLSEAKNYVRNNMLSFMISFQDYEVLIEESSPAIKWKDLCSSIGGSIGLCLGFSLITAFEFIFFIYDYIMVPWKVKKLSETNSKPT